MEGNRFYLSESSSCIDLTTPRPTLSRQISNDDTINVIPPEPEQINKTDQHEYIEMDNHNISNIKRSKSHRELAYDLVDNATRLNNRKASKTGILSSLLKLKGYEDKLKKQQSNHRNMYQLKSVASSRALLQSLGASPQSARSSMYLEDYYKAELGIVDDATIAAHRMEIASEIADILERQDLIIKLGKTLIKTGAPSHRIEAAMEKVGKRLETDGSYAVVPGLIIVTFGDVETHTSETHLIRCSRSLDIGKLETANVIAYRIAKGELNPEEANQLLDNINNSPPTWSPHIVLFGYTMSSAFVAPIFFSGSWTDCWVSAIFGLCVGALTYLSEKMPMFGNVFEMLVTIPIAIITLALYPHVCFAAVAMSSIVVALPGYSLTCAVMELSAKNLISGVVHLVYGLMYTLFLAFGIGYGCSIWKLAYPDFNVDVLSACASSINPYWTFLLLPLITIGLGIIFGAKPIQWIPMIADSALGYGVYYFIGKVAGYSSVITPSAGAFALGLGGNIYGRITKKLAFVPLMGGIIVLVPGSIGVKGAIHLFDGSQDDSNSEFVTQVLGIALSLTLGLFLANLVVYPYGKKRTVFLGF